MRPRQDDRHFSGDVFLELKSWNSDLNFPDICSQVSNWPYSSIGSGNDMAPYRRQAITLTNDDPVYWRIYAALGGDELILLSKLEAWSVASV